MVMHPWEMTEKKWTALDSGNLVTGRITCAENRITSRQLSARIAGMDFKN